MVSEVDLCNRALAALGTRTTISGIQPSDGSNEANTCALLYYPVRDALIRAVHWDFCRAQVSLSQLKASTDTNSTCPVPWSFEYAYPSDCLKARSILPFMVSGNTGSIPLTTAPQQPVQGINAWNMPVRFFIATDKDASNNDGTVVLTNQPNAILVYTRRIVNPDLFDPQFQEALVAALAAHLVPALALNLSLMKGQIQLAENIIGKARITNGNEGPEVQDSIPDWVRARGLYGTFAYGYLYQGWDAMPWPSVL